jgi:hypothetical protein
MLMSSLQAMDIVYIPSLLEFFSQDSTYCFRVVPAQRREPAPKPCSGRLRKASAGNWIEVWSRELPNQTAPEKALISRDGGFVVTVNNLFAGGYGDDAMVIYDRTGKVTRSLALMDFCPDVQPPSIPDSAEGAHIVRGWGRADSIDEGRKELVLSMAPRAADSSREDDLLEVRIRLATGEVVSAYPLLGRPKAPDFRSPIQIEAIHRTPLPRGISPYRCDFDAAVGGGFVIAGPGRDQQGHPCVAVIQVDSAAHILWKVTCEADLTEQVRLIASEDGCTVTYPIVIEDSIGHSRQDATRVTGLSKNGDVVYTRDLMGLSDAVVAAGADGVLLLGDETYQLWDVHPVVRAFDNEGRDSRLFVPPVRFGCKMTMISYAKGLLISDASKGAYQLGSCGNIERIFEGRVRAINKNYHGHVVTVQTNSGSRRLDLLTITTGSESIIQACSIVPHWPVAIAGIYPLWDGSAITFGHEDRFGQDKDLFAVKRGRDGDSLWTYEYGTGWDDCARATYESSPGRCHLAGTSGNDIIIISLVEK